MIRKLLVATATSFALLGAPAFAQDAEKPDFVFTEAPTDHAIGDADAPHTLIVYASNMCPHCGSWFNEEWPTVKAELVKPGRLRVVFRPLPSAPQQLSMIGFMMAECAPEEDYFTVIEHQFERQAVVLEKAKSGGLREEFESIGKVAGLMTDEDRDACLGSETELAAIHRAGERAAAAKISSIPGFILDGELMTGAHKAEDIARRLSAAP